MRTVDTGSEAVNAALDEIWRVLDDVAWLDYQLRRYAAEAAPHVRPPVPGEVRVLRGDLTLTEDLRCDGDLVVTERPSGASMAVAQNPEV